MTGSDPGAEIDSLHVLGGPPGGRRRGGHGVTAEVILGIVERRGRLPGFLLAGSGRHAPDCPFPAFR